MLLQSLYALVDLWWVGRLGENAVAGLAISLQAFFVVLGISQAVAVTALSEISQDYGAGRIAEARRAFSAFTIVAAVIGTAAGIIAFTNADAYVALFTADARVHRFGVDYFEVTTITFLLQVLLIVFGSGLRGSGDFMTPMRFMAVSVTLNIILDPLLIFGLGPVPELGLAGAAWATVASQAIGCALYVRRLIRRSDGRELYWCRPRWSRHFFLGILTRGVPAGFQFLLISAVLGIVLLAVKPSGATWTATVGGGFRVIQQMFLPIIALASAAAATAGQNIGARQPPRVSEAAWTSIRWAAVYGTIAGVLLFFGGGIAGRIFAEGPEDLEVAVIYFHWSAPILAFFGATYVPAFVLQAAGQAARPMIAAVVRVAVLACLVFVAIPALGLPPEWIFGATTATAGLEAVLGLALLAAFLARLSHTPATLAAAQ